jgi:hypothetical protein
VLLNALGLRLELLEVLLQMGDNLFLAVKLPLAVPVTAAALMMTASPAVRMTAVAATLPTMITLTTSAASVFEMHLAASCISIY